MRVLNTVSLPREYLGNIRDPLAILSKATQTFHWLQGTAYQDRAFTVSASRSLNR